MPLHPSAQPILEFMTSGGGLGVSPDTTPAQARAAMDAMTSSELLPKHPVHSVEDTAVPGPAGPVPVRVYRPSAAGSLPVLVWLHGGGWVLGGLDSHDQLCRQLCDAASAVVVSVDYRLAPEHAFPAGLDDCVAAWTWIAGHAADFGGDSGRVALGGDSAGGNLAAVTALLARDERLPQPRSVLLVYPVTDHEFESVSMRENAVGYFLQTDDMRWFFRHYADEAQCADWRVSPLRAPDLSGLPPTLVVTAECDPLRDQGEAYAKRLHEAGVDARALRADGMFHGFFGMHVFMEPAQPAWDAALELLNETLRSDASTEAQR